MTKSGTLIIDGNCPFCRRWGSYLRSWAGLRLAVRSCSEETMKIHPDLSRERCHRAVQLVLDDGKLLEGAQAAAVALSFRPGWSWVAPVYTLPILKQLCDLTYRIIAHTRKRTTDCEACSD